MKKLLLLLFVFAFSCRTVQLQQQFSSTPVVANWTDTTNLKHIHGSLAYSKKDSSIYFSRENSWNSIPTRTEVNNGLNSKFNTTGGNLTGPLGIQTGAANKHLIAVNLSNTSTTNAPKTFDANAYYLGLGHREWNGSSYRLIGLGFRYSFNDHYPAVIGYQETSTSSSTTGDLLFATRPTTTNVAPTIRLKIVAAGNVKSYGPITANEDVATKGYVDTSYKPVKTISTNGAVSVSQTPNGYMITNNASAATTYTLPPANAGAVYEFWKVGASIMTIVGPIADVNKIGTKTVSSTESSTSISLKCNGANWVVLSKNGTWTTQ